MKTLWSKDVTMNFPPLKKIPMYYKSADIRKDFSHCPKKEKPSQEDLTCLSLDVLITYHKKKFKRPWLSL